MKTFSDRRNRPSFTLRLINYGLAIGSLILVAVNAKYPSGGLVTAFFVTATITAIGLLTELHAHMNSVTDTLDDVRERIEAQKTTVQCHYVGDDDTAMRYIIAQLPSTETFRDTHIRSAHTHKKYDEKTYTLLHEGLKAFLKRPGTRFYEVIGSITDSAYIQHIASAEPPVRLGLGRFLKSSQHTNQLHFHQLHNHGAVMNFIILEYIPDDAGTKHSEVFFGWGRHTPELEHEPTEEAVFRSKDDRLVKEFRAFYRVLLTDQMSTPVKASDLLVSPNGKRLPPAIVHKNIPIALEPFLKETLHHYHLTKNKQGKPVWIHLELDFKSTHQSGDRLCVTAPIFPPRRGNLWVDGER